MSKSLNAPKLSALIRMVVFIFGYILFGGVNIYPILHKNCMGNNLISNRYLYGGKTEDLAKDGASKIPNTTLHMIAKASHFTQSEIINTKIKEFLK